MSIKIISAQEAASHVKNDDNVAFSGFTPAGAPKTVAGAIAAMAKKEHAKGNPFQIGMLTGASTGDSLDGELIRAEAVKFRTPYQSNKSLRAAMNSGKVHYFDRHLSGLAQDMRYGFFGDLDVAIIEAADVSDDGEIVLTSAVGITPTAASRATKVIIELNSNHPKEIKGLHDLVELQDPPYRKEIAIYSPEDRIGSPVIMLPTS
jgi:acyl-CoA hydrolase